MTDRMNPFGERDTQPLPKAPEGRLLAPGEVVANRFVVEAKLGDGGAGAVYKVHDRQTNRTRALKILRPERIATPGALEALAKEAAIALEISHPNIVRVYDVRTETDPPFITMELVPGESLWTWMKRYRREKTPWPMATAAAIVRGVLDGLAAAHAAGVIHRDIKPENIILTSDPAPGKAPLKIIDFGIAQGGGALAGGVTEGTRTYMAPEASYRDQELGPEADIFSLSVIFYELLVAAPPQYWSPPSHGRTDTPAAIDDLIRDGLSPNALVRPQTAEAYRKRLEDALDAASAAPKSPAPAPAAQTESRSPPAPRFNVDLKGTNGFAGPQSRPKDPAPAQGKPAAGATPAASPPQAPAPKPPPPAAPDVPAMLQKAQALASKARDMTRSQTAGWNVPWNNAHQLYKDAAATGDLAAKVAYGRFLEQGHGMWVEPQYAAARSWYESAAKAGFGPAMAALGDMERFGRGCPKNGAASIAWYVKAGEAGYAAGDYLAGFAYRAKLRDWGNIVDYPKARYHLERAASKGDGAAMVHLAEMLAEGQGGPKDRAGARAWFERAIKAGHASAADSIKSYGL